ncbi:MAG: ribosomal RNA small subunit methyltransferase A [Synergistetes bacterium]|nr:MAG: Dimethyladenosine transferase [bacterium 42_11]MBC7331063.1 ribosomal RNA small subunit methyltransferase A [Synergistota bacterium]MDK2871819.1 rRNA (adenine1518-N6/adenine1519-N6)-dimethyltransferase [bacterium]
MKALAHKVKFRFSKSKGQSFLYDPQLLDKICRTANLSKNSFVLEIGSGMGNLSLLLSQYAAKVVGVEVDEKLCKVLDEVLWNQPNFFLIEGDILKVDLSFLEREKKKYEVKVVANLPYRIATEIILYLLEKGQGLIDELYLMLQKEVAERIASPPRRKTRGALSVIVQYYADVQILFDVPPRVFYPQPKVTSSFLKLLPYKSPREKWKVEDEDLFFRIVKEGFKRKRKTLLNNLKGLFDEEAIKEALKELSLPETVRAEELSLEEWAILSNKLKRGGEENERPQV